jgi:TolB-like protein
LSTVALLSLAIIAGVVTRVQQTQANFEQLISSVPELKDVPDKSLAVLPFLNLSDDGSSEYFSDGLAEELLNRLNRVAELKVSARTSSFSYKNKDIGITEIARRLGVRHVLEGSVRKAGDRIRVTASLINAQTGFELWSQNFDHQLENVFAIQDEISAEVVDALKVSLLGTPATQTTANLDAYQLYLEGRFELHRRSADSIRRSKKLFEQAISLDSEFARAYMELATATYILPSFAPLDRSTVTVQARSLARKAYSLDPTLGKALALVALISQGEGDWKSARSDFEVALEISKHESIIHLWYASLLASTGHTRRALREVQVSYELDPQSGLVSGWLCALNFSVGDSEKASQHCTNALSLGFAYANFLQAQLLIEGEQYALAEAAFIAFSSEFTVNDFWVGPFMAAIRNPSSQSDGIQALHSLESGLGSRWDIIGMYTLLSDNDSAFDSATLTGDGTNTMNHIWMPHTRPFRQDVRFEKLMNEVGLISYWQQYGWPDLCDRAGNDFVCE